MKQVTRLKCGGFIFAVRFNHTTMDGIGFVNFVNAVTEIARGAQYPSISPVWDRHLMSAPPATRSRGESSSQELESLRLHYKATTKGTIPLEEMVNKSFFFGQS